jgi:hypothetical protein
MSKYLNLLETIEIHIDIKSFESTLQPILMCILEIWYMDFNGKKSQREARIKKIDFDYLLYLL